MSSLIPNQYSHLTSKHPSFLTYFHLPSYPSSVRLSWSVSYTDLTPKRTRKWKCRYLDQASLEGNWQSSSHVWGAWTSTVLPGLQVSEDTRWEMPPPLLIRSRAHPYDGPPYNGGYTVGNASTPPNRTRVNTLQWNLQWHHVAGGFVIVYLVLGSVVTWNHALIHIS